MKNQFLLIGKLHTPDGTRTHNLTLHLATERGSTIELKAHWQEAVKNHRSHIHKIAITDNHLFERKLRKHNVKQTQKQM
jgi:hypothetical protein